MNRLKHLFTPIRIAGMDVKNRLVMAPMDTNLATPEQYVTQFLIHYFATRGKSPFG